MDVIYRGSSERMRIIAEQVGLTLRRSTPSTTGTSSRCSRSLDRGVEWRPCDPDAARRRRRPCTRPRRVRRLVSARSATRAPRSALRTRRPAGGGQLVSRRADARPRQAERRREETPWAFSPSSGTARALRIQDLPRLPTSALEAAGRYSASELAQLGQQREPEGKRDPGADRRPLEGQRQLERPVDRRRRDLEPVAAIEAACDRRDRQQQRVEVGEARDLPAAVRPPRRAGCRACSGAGGG